MERHRGKKGGTPTKRGNGKDYLIKRIEKLEKRVEKLEKEKRNVAPPGLKKKKKCSKYNIYMRDAISTLKEKNPEKYMGKGGHQTAFKEAAGKWSSVMK